VNAGPLPPPVTILDHLTLATAWLKARGADSPRLTAEVLLARVLASDRIFLYTHGDRPLSAGERDAYRALLRRRAAGEPVAYITGEREFYGRPFAVGPGILIPRPETELLVEEALRLLRATGANPAPVIADIGCGSGCIAVTVLAELPGARGTAVDASPAAIEATRTNALRHGVADRLTAVPGDLSGPLPDGACDLLAANLPYIPSDRIRGLAPEVLREPREALDGGADGLVLVRRLIADLPRVLAPGGWCLLEVDETHGAMVPPLLAEGPFTRCRVLPDMAGRDRIVAFSKESA
jgi:release factor glutamine methyltransferase